MVVPLDFANPVTGTAYRLRADGAAGWRVTKTVDDHGKPIIRHLRGSVAPGVAPPAAVVDRFVRGDRQPPGERVAADPRSTMADVVLLDLDRVADVVTALAAEARTRRSTGAQGFRPGCATLRRQEREALAQAAGACQAMAVAWRDSGLGANPGLPTPPDWLVAALGDLQSAAPGTA